MVWARLGIELSTSQVHREAKNDYSLFSTPAFNHALKSHTFKNHLAAEKVSVVVDNMHIQSILFSLSCFLHLFLTGNRTPSLHIVWKGSSIAEVNQVFVLILIAVYNMPK